MGLRTLRRSVPAGAFAAAMLGVSVAFMAPPLAQAQTDMPPLRQALEQGPETTTAAPDREAMVRFYLQRGYRPVFVGEAGPSPAAQSIVQELARAPEWGLPASAFPLHALSEPKTNGKWSPAQVAAADLQLVAGVLTYARQARGGRISDPHGLLSANLDRTPPVIEPLQVLDDVIASAEPGELLRSYQPQHPQFLRLKNLYAKLLSEMEAAPKVTIPRSGPYLMVGTRHEDVVAVRRRLSVPADPDKDEDVYDKTLSAAVRAFQDSASLEGDGIVGPSTRRAMNARAGEAKLKAVLANMEQWRWMPRDLGQAHLLVNIPAFTVDFVEDGVSKLQERVIVGKPETPTPVFSKNMTTIVVRPAWKLPNSIKLEKLRSAQRRGGSVEDEGYSIKRGKRSIKSWDVDWNKVNLREYEFVQPAGESNALGRVKFLFPNHHSVYLHDTPMRSLFNASERLFSHGCVRLRNPLTLAQLLLDRDKGVDEHDAEWLAKKGPVNNEITLDRPIPMHIGYFTVWVKDDGEVQHLDDPYGHQQRITLALDQKWNEIEREEPAAEVEAGDLPRIYKSQPTRLAATARSGAAGVVRRAPPPGMMRLVGVAPPPKVQFFKPSPRPQRNTVGDMIRSQLGAP